ncbi:hypothetical protein QQ045_014125 [Rhodiola kirilowii]
MGVGLSVLIGLKAAALFILFALFRSFRFTIVALPFLYASLIDMLVAIASHPHINVPLLLGKRPDGSFPLWSKIMFSPLLFFVRIFSSIRRAVSREEPYTEICDGVYVGGWPCTADRMPPGSPAVIDCTAELPRKAEFAGQAYLCIPTWDTRSPQPMEIESAVKWACHKRALNMPVFIHCAYGIGAYSGICGNASICRLTPSFNSKALAYELWWCNPIYGSHSSLKRAMWDNLSSAYT